MNQYFIENNSLESNLKLINAKIRNITFSFYTENGLFNKKGLDLGTKILLENVNLNKETFLDLGCGCGPIGIFLSKAKPNSKIDMVDINKNAIKISKKSIKYNKIKNVNIFISDGYSNITKSYDCILLNPPIHAGKTKVYELIKDSSLHLKKEGELWIVIRKNHGAKSLINDFEKIYNVEICVKDHGFWILKFRNRE